MNVNSFTTLLERWEIFVIPRQNLAFLFTNLAVVATLMFLRGVILVTGLEELFDSFKLVDQILVVDLLGQVKQID